MGFGKKNGSFRGPAPARSRSPRICMPTWRNFTRRPYRCSLYEAQDVLVEIDDVDLVHLDMGWGEVFSEKWLRIPLYHDASRKLIYANPGLKKISLSREYEAFVVICNHYWDLPYINAIKGWRDQCKVSICWIDEIWAAEIPNYKYWLAALSQFDYVFIGLKGSVSVLSQSINRSCYWLPGGVDALRFSPLPNPPNRVIDVYSVGRRHEGSHGMMLKAAERGELFYVYDTLSNIASINVYDHRQHRNLFANMAKRSRYFMVAAAKTGEAQGQVEIGYRYYEGAAAGTVMVGEAPDCDAYRELFTWPEPVIQIQPDGSDIMAVLSELDSDPKRSAAISMGNTKGALLHHDWVYRWKEMFRVAGIEPSQYMAEREWRLKNLAGFCPEPGNFSPYTETDRALRGREDLHIAE
jgi:Glycosyl transferases group 1